MKTKIDFSWVWELEAQDQGASRMDVYWGLLSADGILNTPSSGEDKSCGFRLGGRRETGLTGMWGLCSQ